MTETLPAPEVYDFARPSTLAREHARVLELAFETFARQWGTQLTAKVRAVSQVTCEQVQMTTYDEYAASLPALTGMVLLPIADVVPKGSCRCPSTPPSPGSRTRSGASKPLPTPDRTFTPIEQALVRKIVEDALDDLRYSFRRAARARRHRGRVPVQLAVRPGRPEGRPHDRRLVHDPRRGARRPRHPRAAGRRGAGRSSARPPRTSHRPTPAPSSTRSSPPSRWRQPAVRARHGPAVAGPPPGRRRRPACATHPQHRPLTIAVDGEPVGTAAVGANGSRLAGIVVTTTSEQPA